MKTIRLPLYIYQTKLYSSRGILVGIERVETVIRTVAQRADRSRVLMVLDKPRAELTLKG